MTSSNHTLSLGHIQELAAIGVYLQYLVGWPHNITAVQLAAHLLPYTNHSSFMINGRSVLSMLRTSTGKQNLSSHDAYSLLLDFQALPHEKQTWMAPAWLSIMTISGLCVVARLYSRWHTNARLRVDDWLVLAAWLFASVTNIEDSWTAIHHSMLYYTVLLKYS